jgi:hypothetical protein
VNIKHLIKLASLISTWSIHSKMASFDDATQQFIIPFPSYPYSSSPAPVTKTILVDQFLVIHALAWLVVDELNLFHLFLVINRL